MIEARLPDGRTMVLESPLHHLAVLEPWEPEPMLRVGSTPTPCRSIWHLRLRGVADGIAYYEHTTPLWRASVEPLSPWRKGTVLGYVEARDEHDAHWEAHCRWPKRGGVLKVERVNPS